MVPTPRLTSSLLLSLVLSGCYDGSEMRPGTAGPTTGAADTTAASTGTDATAASTGTDAPTTDTPTTDAPTTDGLTTADGTTTTGITTDLTTDATTGLTNDTGDSSTGDPLADCPRLRVDVAPDPTLNVRPTPSTAQEPIASLVHGQIVETVAAVQGESIMGNTLWYQIADPAGYVSGVFVDCTTDPLPEPPEGFYLPVACGLSVKCTQGNNGDTSHNGITKYAFDFGIGLNTPVHAMATGVVTNIYDLTGPGDDCYNGGGPECGPYGNLVILLHGDGTTTLYKHLNEIHVKLGDMVERGGVVGLSGTTGYSTGPHVHVMRMMNCGLNNCQSIPMEFVEAGVPVQGQTVVSQNCP